MANLTYDTFTLDVAEIPETSIVTMLQRTFAHKMGNEVASAVVARIKSELQNPEASRDVVEAWRTSNAGKVAEWTAELRSGIVAAIKAGTLGTRAGGPRMDPVERKFNDLVLKHIRAQLKGVFGPSYKMPKDDDTVIDFGGGKTRVLSQMVANVKGGSQADALRKAAERAIAEESRLAKRAEEAGQKAANPDELGL